MALPGECPFLSPGASGAGADGSFCKPNLIQERIGFFFGLGSNGSDELDSCQEMATHPAQSARRWQLIHLKLA
jgi:hypothetical protein